MDPTQFIFPVVSALPYTETVTPEPSPTIQLIASASEAYQKVSGFVENIDYTGWQGNVKIIFSILTVLFLGLAVFSFMKARALLKAHASHGAHGHGGGHKTDAHAPAAAHEEHVTQHGQEHHEPAVADGSDFGGLWEDIKQRSESVREADWKLSVIEADKLVDGVLKEKGFEGESMGERLMMIKPDQLHSLQGLWDAHKLRNLLVHESGYNVRHDQVLGAINAFEKVLRELGAIA